jgi:hypothetical protein
MKKSRMTYARCALFYLLSRIGIERGLADRRAGEAGVASGRGISKRREEGMRSAHRRWRRARRASRVAQHILYPLSGDVAAYLSRLWKAAALTALVARLSKPGGNSLLTRTG